MKSSVPFLLIFVFILNGDLLFSQENQVVTTIYLKNKSRLIGFLKEEVNGIYHLQLKGSEIVMQVPVSEVKRIVQNESTGGVYKPENIYEFKERGFYNITSMKINSGSNLDDELSTGFGFETVNGYMIHKYVGVGLGLGYDYYGEESYKALIPLFVEARGYLLGRRNAYFYSLSGGYSWGLKDAAYSITSAPGGWMFHPAMGLRFGGKKHFNTTLDFGIRFQKAKWLHEPLNDWIKSSEYNYFYKRFVIRLGIQI